MSAGTPVKSPRFFPFSSSLNHCACVWKKCTGKRVCVCCFLSRLKRASVDLVAYYHREYYLSISDSVKHESIARTHASQRSLFPIVVNKKKHGPVECGPKAEIERVCVCVCVCVLVCVCLVIVKTDIG